MDWLKGGLAGTADDRKYRGLVPLVGGDPLPYGLAENALSIEAMITYALQQGLIPRRMPSDEMFVDPS
jgi:4,5-dihydroxyphthalate decarboxylase